MALRCPCFRASHQLNDDYANQKQMDLVLHLALPVVRVCRDCSKHNSRMTVFGSSWNMGND
ncbi:hypothetical protein KIN20_026926 [Parelaphostrongylus tenuis]|uniref:Uncharacterized protein n=1 Tax=Parelaphostrongylus tenuis TaxID=148309 RepID=A0AAD5QYU7_PARTN|nr:hypothetical protein KIN20_026926 [Parelaphostrongylus tenuis]